MAEILEDGAALCHARADLEYDGFNVGWLVLCCGFGGDHGGRATCGAAGNWLLHCAGDFRAGYACDCMGDCYYDFGDFAL